MLGAQQALAEQCAFRLGRSAMYTSAGSKSTGSINSDRQLYESSRHDGSLWIDLVCCGCFIWSGDVSSVHFVLSPPVIILLTFCYLLNPVTRQPSLAAVYRGKRIPCVEITVGHELGKGAFGQVCAGTWTRSNGRTKDVALKQLDASRCKLGLTTEQMKESFLWEAERASSVQHPFVCEFYGAVLEEHQQYMVFPLCSGGTLDSVIGVFAAELQRGPQQGQAQEDDNADPTSHYGQYIPVTASSQEAPSVDSYSSTGSRAVVPSLPSNFLCIIWRFLLQIASALETLHAQGMIHRDFKTENILLTSKDPKEADAVLADLGVALVDSLLSGTARETTEVEKGIKDRWWSSPEEVKRTPVSAKSDVFAWGLVAFHLLTGKQPWRGTGHSLREGMRLTAEGQTSKELQLPRDCPLVGLLHKCWATDPAGRPSASELVQELTALAPLCFSDPCMAAQELIRHHTMIRLYTTREERENYVPSVVSVHANAAVVPEHFVFSFDVHRPDAKDSSTIANEETKIHLPAETEDHGNNDGTFRELPEVVGDFLHQPTDQARVLTVIGDGGMGKSLTLDRVALSIPLALHLRLFHSRWSRSELRDTGIDGALRLLGCTEAMIAVLKQQQLVILVDAWDEVTNDVSDSKWGTLQEELKLNVWPHTKVILTSRRSALPELSLWHRVGTEALWVRYILPFSVTQCKQYIRLRGQDDRLEAVGSRLLQNPFVLRLYASCPRAAVRHAQSQKEIYAAVSQAWVSDVNEQLQQWPAVFARLVGRHSSLLESFLDWACCIALAQFEQQDIRHLISSAAELLSNHVSNKVTPRQVLADLRLLQELLDHRESSSDLFAELDKTFQDIEECVRTAHSVSKGYDEEHKTRSVRFLTQFKKASVVSKASSDGARFEDVHDRLQQTIRLLSVTQSHMECVWDTVEKLVAEEARQFFRGRMQVIHTGAAEEKDKKQVRSILQESDFVRLQCRAVGRLLERCVLKTALGPHNKHSFIHKSMRDYFAALAMHRGARVDTIKQHALCRRCVTSDPGVQLWAGALVDVERARESGWCMPNAMALMVQSPSHDVSFEETAWRIIQVSKRDQGVRIAAANCMTILNTAGVAFAGRDLRDICPGDHRWNKSYPLMDLSGGVFDNAQLRGAQLGGARMVQVSLNGADLGKADLRGSQWDSKPLIFTDAHWITGLVLCHEKKTKDASAAIVCGYGCLRQINLCAHLPKRHSVRWFEADPAIQSENCCAIVLCDDDTTLLTGDDTAIRIWNVADGKHTSTLHGHKGVVEALAYRKRMLFSGDSVGAIKQWRPYDGQCVRTLHGHTDGVKALVVSADGRTLYSGSLDHTIRQWNMDGACTGVYEGHNHPINTLVLSSNGQTLYSGGDDCVIRRWRTIDGKCQSIIMQGKRVEQLVLSHDDRSLYVRLLASRVIIAYETNSMGVLKTLTHNEEVNAMAVARSDNMLICMDDLGTLYRWSLNADAPVTVFDGPVVPRIHVSGHGDVIDALALSSDGLVLYSKGNLVNTEYLSWDTRTGALLRSSSTAPQDVQWTPTGPPWDTHAVVSHEPQAHYRFQRSPTAPWCVEQRVNHAQLRGAPKGTLVWRSPPCIPSAWQLNTRNALLDKETKVLLAQLHEQGKADAYLRGRFLSRGVARFVDQQ